MPVAEVETQAVHIRFIANGETVPVNRQVNDLGIQRSREQDGSGEEAKQAHCRREVG